MSRLDRGRWAPWLLAGLGTAAFAVLGPLDGRDALTPHVAQHLLLGDVAAPLLLLGVPPALRARLAGALGSRLWSPPVALVLWTVVTTAWYVPAVHRAAVSSGVVHALDHASFLAFGLLVWLAVFDVRPSRPLREAVWRGGLPWWARHLYAAGSRALMLPAALIVSSAQTIRSMRR